MERRVRVVLVLGALAAAVVFLYAVRGIFIPFILGVFITYVTVPLVERMERRQVPRVVAILLVYTLLGAAFWLLVLYVWPKLAGELNRMLGSLPAQTQRLSDHLAQIVSGPVKGRLGAIVKALATAGIRESQALVGKVAGRVFEVTLDIFSRALLIVLGPVIAFYLTRDLDALRRGTLEFLPVAIRDEVLGLLHEINLVLSGYIRGQLAVSFFVGLVTGLGLVWLRIPYALLIGLLAGLFDIVPYFGPVIAGIPAVGLALSRSPWHAVYVLLLLLAIHQFEGAILVPRVIGDRTGLHPVLVIFAVLAGGQLFGVVGMLVAVPVAAVLKVLLRFAARKLIIAHPLS